MNEIKKFIGKKKKEIKKLSAFEILLFASIFFLPIMRAGMKVSGRLLTASEILFGISVLLFAYGIYKKREALPKTSCFFPLVILFLGSFLAFIIDYLATGRTYYQDFIVLGYLVFFTAILTSYLSSRGPNACNKAISVIFYSSVVVAFFSFAGMIVYILKSKLSFAINTFVWSRSGRLLSVFLNPNYASLFMGCIAIFFVMLYFERKKTKYLLLSLFMIFSNFFTVSKAGVGFMLFTIGVLFIFLFISKNVNGKMLFRTSILILLVCLVAISLTYSPWFNRIDDMNESNNGMKRRVAAWSSANVSEIRPVPTNSAQIQEKLRENTGKNLKYHNFILTALFQFGIFGAIFLVVFFYMIIRAFQRAYKSAFRLRAIGLFAAIIFIILWGFFHDPITNKVLWLFFSMLIALNYTGKK